MYGILILIVIFSISEEVFSECSDYYKDNESRVVGTFEKADKTVHVKIIDVEYLKDTGEIEAKYEVIEVFKGEAPKVNASKSIRGLEYGIQFENGEEYMLFFRGENYFANTCFGSVFLPISSELTRNNSKNIIEQIRKQKK